MISHWSHVDFKAQVTSQVTPPVQQNCHSDNFLDQLRAFPPPFGQSPSGLPITQDFCLTLSGKLTRNNGLFLDT